MKALQSHRAVRTTDPKLSTYSIFYNSIVYRKNNFFCCVDLHGLGALAGGDEALLFSHQPLKGNPCEEKRKGILFDLSMFFNLTTSQEHNVIHDSVLVE